eukprot:m.139074 g.139074  ORF g.139074 m.139074 type:complete len:386 (+) comp30031_c0_seq1:93-1250(+)
MGCQMLLLGLASGIATMVAGSTDGIPDLNLNGTKDALVFYVGSGNYAVNPSQTTKIYAFSLSNNELKPHYRSISVGPNPSWICYDGRSKMYACLESQDSVDIGGVAALAFSQDAGAKLINVEPWPSANHHGPAHCAVDASGKFVLAASYAEGQLGIFPVSNNGRVETPTIFEYDTGSHAHMVVFSPNQDFVYVPDLGLDCVHIYSWNDAIGEVKSVGALQFPSLTHPRHMAFTKSGAFAFLLTESTNQLIVLGASESTGMLKELSRMNTVPLRDLNASFAAEVVVHPNQRHVFVSNRGVAESSVAVFLFSESEHTLELVKRITRDISWPRGMQLSPDGEYLIVANQQGAYADKILAYKVDVDGAAVELTAVAQAEVPAPTDITFV